MFKNINKTILNQVEANRNKAALSEEWIPQDEIEGNSYCKYPDL